MQASLLYLLKATVCSGIMLLYYWIALRNKRFHYYNRFYLLMAVALSLLLPFINIQLWQFNSSNTQVIHLLNVVVVNSTEVSTSAKAYTLWQSILPVLLYALITVFMISSFLFSLIKLYRYRRIFPAEQLGNILFINTDLPQAPFSFFNNLFWKKDIDIGDATGRQIFKHELTHIEQKHSWDKLFLRIVTLVCWMNPFYWLIQKELSLIHEFIADEKAIENKSAEAFALVLLQSQYGNNIFSPAQSFNYSPIKRRLFMLTTFSKTNYSYARRIMILPLLAGTILLFAFKLKENNKDTLHTNTSFTLIVDAGHGGSDAGVVGINNTKEKDINLLIAKKVQELAPEYGIAVTMTRTEDVAVDLKRRVAIAEDVHPDAFVSIHVSTTSEKQTNKNEIDVYIPRDETNDNFSQSQLLGSSLLQVAKKDFPVNSVLKQRKEEGIYVLDKNSFPAVIIECGYINNTATIQQLNDAAKTEQLARDILQGVAAFANAAPQTTSNAVTDTIKKTPLYIVDGKETTAADVNKIDAGKIESITVLKDTDAIKKYGEKGKNGVVLITLKKEVTPPAGAASLMPKNPQAEEEMKKTLKVIDGEIVTNEAFQKLNANNIYSISVWKGEDAVKKWGEKGRDGVIEITTNKSGMQQTTSSSKPVIIDKKIVYPKADSSADFTKDTYMHVLATAENTDTTIKNKQHYNASEQTQDTPLFPGGVEGWKSYLIKNLKADIPAKHKAPPGTYTVVVSFLVDAAGNVSEVKALKDPGYGTAKEAVRVIKEGPKWIPVETNGKAIAYRQQQAISFFIEK